MQGHLDVSGPVTVDDLADSTGLSPSSVTIALEALRARGFAISGQFEPERGEQWCARRLLARIHAYTRDRRRAEIRPISQEEWQSFLQAWWHAAPATRLHGRAGLAEVIEQFQGFEWPAGDWERLFAERVDSYRPEWLDDLCLSGEVAWGRLSVLEPAADDGSPTTGDRSKIGQRRSGKTPSRRTPITFMLRRGSALAAAGPPRGCGAGRAHRGLRAGGARRPARPRRTVSLRSSDPHSSPAHPRRGRPVGRRRPRTHRRRRIQRCPLAPARSHPRSPAASDPIPRPGSRGRRGTGARASRAAGRCWQPPSRSPTSTSWPRPSPGSCCCAGAWCPETYTLKERLSVPWREILWALRRLEARGLIRGGHFITGVTGEQFADEEAAPLLRACRGS